MNMELWSSLKIIGRQKNHENLCKSFVAKFSRESHRSVV